MSAYLENKKKATPASFIGMKQRGEKIAMLTAYDYTTARLMNETPIDIILVGDSAANVMAGYDSTLPIGMDEMVIYARAVTKGAPHTYVICDMPFGSYHVSVEEAVRNAIRLTKETGCDAVKLEGGADFVPVIKGIIRAGIPVMGHLGLTPQSINIFGSYAVRAKETAEAERLMADALLLQEAGCMGIVLEKIPAALAAQVSQRLTIPTIGIGAGHQTDGQVLVVQDMLGLNESFKPKFVRRYEQLHTVLTDAFKRYAEDVKRQHFPHLDEQY